MDLSTALVLIGTAFLAGYAVCEFVHYVRKGSDRFRPPGDS